ncbi:hypothetical protein K445DRAFT_10599 [Daldinia sp. EC12]|nr:hypothetical protein K445DRAFT_10599 [Daldinia sp. EC12]
MKRSREAKKPADEHIEHFQRLRSRRLSIHQREEPKNSHEAIHGLPSQVAPELLLHQRVDLNSGRRRVSASEKSHSVTHGHKVTPDHKTHQQRKSKSIDAGITGKGIKVLTREEEASIDSAKGAIPTIRAIPWDLPKQTTTNAVPSATYEPAHLLRQNAEYFDTDQDGIIWLGDSYKGCRKLGWGITYSSLASFFLHSILSYPTGRSYIPDLLLRVRYDSNTNGGHITTGHAPYDEKGQARRDQVCESILAKYDSDNKGGMNNRDILRFWRDQRSASAFYTWSLTVLEWTALYLALRHNNGIIPNEDIRTAFDGSILFKRSEERQRKNEMHHKHTVNATRGEDRNRSERQFDPVKLAVAIIIGLAIFIWALPGLLRNPPSWGKYWWEKNNAPQVVSWSNPGLADDW